MRLGDGGELALGARAVFARFAESAREDDGAARALRAAARTASTTAACGTAMNTASMGSAMASSVGYVRWPKSSGRLGVTR